MTIAEMLAPVGGLPEGVTEDSVLDATVSPGLVTIGVFERLPPRYVGARVLPPFSPRECAAPDEQFVSYTGGACATIALPRNRRVEWTNDGSGWKRA